MWGFIRREWPLLLLLVAFFALYGWAWVSSRNNARVEAARTEIEQSDAEALPGIVVRPARVERSSRGVVDQVENELDEASIQRPEDGDGGDAAARRMDDSWRGGIERLRDEASRY